MPAAAQVSTLYLKIVWNTSNTQAIIDEVNLAGVSSSGGATVAAPTFSEPSGTVDRGTEVTISAAEGCTIYYTLDGTDPTTSSTQYISPITINVTTTVKAIAVDADGNESLVATANYTVQKTAPTLSFNTSSYMLTIDEATTFTGQELTNPDNLTVAYSSTNTTVATVSDAGVVTLTGTTGTTTIRAYFAGNDLYNPLSVSYTVTVYDPNEKGSITNPYTVTEIKNLTEAPSGNMYVKAFIVGCYNNGSNQNFTTTNFNIASNLALADSPTETDVDNTIALQLPNSSAIRTAFALTGKPYNAGVAQILVCGSIEKYINGLGVKSPTSCEKIAEQVYITAAGMATYYTDCALDYTDCAANMRAYTASVTSDGAITYTRVYQVPANTAVVLYNPGNAAASNLVPVATQSETVGSNDLIGTLTEIRPVAQTTTEGATNYLLNDGDEGVGFYKASGSHGLAAHHAYLQVPAAAATEGIRSFYGFNENDPTGISTMDATPSTGRIFDLQGRRVTTPRKGLYIVSGKKVVLK